MGQTENIQDILSVIPKWVVALLLKHVRNSRQERYLQTRMKYVKSNSGRDEWDIMTQLHKRDPENQAHYMKQKDEKFGSRVYQTAERATACQNKAAFMADLRVEIMDVSSLVSQIEVDIIKLDLLNEVGIKLDIKYSKAPVLMNGVTVYLLSEGDHYQYFV